ncbi:MAG: translation elongation factor 4 [Patescibacteria group bacterium]
MIDNIRNFVIIAHIDAGKSTLADRLLEITQAVDRRKMQPQYLDSMDLERERGITIKMQPVCMNYQFKTKNYQLNLIDTPGHIDFSYEVSRSLAAVEGAILLIDATQGIQAQTIGNLDLAKKHGLTIIPVINKIDLAIAKIEESIKEIVNLLQIKEEEIIKISAKEGTNVEKVLERVIEKIPAPKGLEEPPLRALIFDSKYDSHKGVIAFIRIFDGQIKKGEKIYLMQAKAEGDAKEVGVFRPELSPINQLSTGEIGYIATGIKESTKVRTGDTITSKFEIRNSLPGSRSEKLEIKPLDGYEEPQAKIFLSIYPKNADDFEDLKIGLEKLKLTDASLYFKAEFKEGLGRGFQCGFLGLLHSEIITERLKREFGLELVLSIPSVLYKVKTQNQKEKYIYTSADWPDQSQILSSQELWARMKIITPLHYFGSISRLMENLEVKYIKTDYLGEDKTEFIYEISLREIIVKNLYDRIKSASKGFASMDYEILDWREIKLVRLDILILEEKEESLSKIVPEKEAHEEGRKTVEKLKEVLPPQLFALPLQAVIGGKIVARETIRAQRRDVIAPLYGGDYTRKRKLLEKQKKGKRELKERARVRIPPNVFFEILKK